MREEPGYNPYLTTQGANPLDFAEVNETEVDVRAIQQDFRFQDIEPDLTLHRNSTIKIDNPLIKNKGMAKLETLLNNDL